MSKVYKIYIYGAYFKLQRWPTTSKFKGYLKITDLKEFSEAIYPIAFGRNFGTFITDKRVININLGNFARIKPHQINKNRADDKQILILARIQLTYNT